MNTTAQLHKNEKEKPLNYLKQCNWKVGYICTTSDGSAGMRDTKRRARVLRASNVVRRLEKRIKSQLTF